MNPNPAGSQNPYAAVPPGGATYPPYAQPAPDTAGSTKLGTTLMVLATVLIGLMAGLFFAYDISVMPGLADADERTYVTAMQNFNAEIDGNGLFGMAFILALLAAGASAVIEFRKGRRTVALFVGAAAVAYLVVLMITFTVNIPLNNELKDLGDAAKLTDFSVVDKFKTTWVSTNIVRTLLCTAALTALSRALVLYGRATARR
ncbi:anthrone oxygenase family protein [Streptomyces bambusae]|uniref:DUF1772 domain-containing protein n=1 Tax=Streptomyces bambusae TaxID=1550616 RepID=A0ABS6ZEA0_9ACTN|nr:DUF1772 domain-containing protein [Streptomyces bambusae]MBW5486053.1 DUF1772 domain-containing protein [Streptomyces bambusae]